MTAEEKLKDLYKERDFTLKTLENGIIVTRGQASVCMNPADIDLIANLVVERISKKISKFKSPKLKFSALQLREHSHYKVRHPYP